MDVAHLSELSPSPQEIVRCMRMCIAIVNYLQKWVLNKYLSVSRICLYDALGVISSVLFECSDFLDWWVLSDVSNCSEDQGF